MAQQPNTPEQTPSKSDNDATTPQPRQRPQGTEKDDVSRAPESGDKPDAMTNDER